MIGVVRCRGERSRGWWKDDRLMQWTRASQSHGIIRAPAQIGGLGVKSSVRDGGRCCGTKGTN